jgi:hypothetical protein
MATITKQHARKLVRKLEAVVVTGQKAHDYAHVYRGDEVIATFGIRRGSKQNLPHPHIAEALHINRHDTLRLANCPLSREEWIQMLLDGGHIEPEDSEPDE